MRIHQIGAMIALLGVSFSASALNRCTDAAGKVSYSDKPCAGAEQQAKVKIIDSKGLTPEKRPARNGEAPAVARTTSPGAGQPGDGPRAESGRTGGPGPTCTNAMRTYDDQATTRIKPNLIDMELARTAAEEACGKRVPKMREQVVAEDAEEKRRLRAAVIDFCNAHPADQRCRP